MSIFCTKNTVKIDECMEICYTSLCAKLSESAFTSLTGKRVRIPHGPATVSGNEETAVTIAYRVRRESSSLKSRESGDLLSD